MGDTTNHNLTVYYCPPEQVKAVLEIIENYLHSNDYGDYDAPGGALNLGGTYGSWDVSVGNVDEIVSAMGDYAPGAYYEVFDEPKYEWLGSLRRYTPELGLFSAECDSDGSPVWDVNAILKIVDECEDKAAIQKALGQAWDDALCEFLPPEDQRIVPAIWEHCPNCGEWATKDNFDTSCKVCVEVLTEREAKAQSRVVLDHLPDTDLCYVVARPSTIVWECGTCADASTLSHQHKVEVVGLAWPTEAETHKAHHGFGIGAGNHMPQSMRIKEVIA